MDEICRLYIQACHGAGAAARWAARDRLEEVARSAGVSVGALLTDRGLDLAAYFASRPIDRPT